MTEPRSLLIIRLSSLGDTLLATPLLRQARVRFPKARIDMLIDERFADAVRYNPHIDRVIEYSRTASLAERRAQKRDTLASLPDVRYDAIIDLQRNIRSIKFRAGLRSTGTFAVNKSRAKKLALVYLGWNLYGNDIVPIAERYRQAASALGIEDDGGGLELWLPEETSQAAYPPAQGIAPKTLFESFSSVPRIAIAPGARHATKQWIPERFAESSLRILERLGGEGKGGEIVLLGTEADNEACDAVESALGGRCPVVRPHRNPSVYETARELDQSHLLLANDTGVAHIAAARRIPVVTIFGSTTREFGFAPYRTPSETVEAPRHLAPCRPCTHIGRAECPKGHWNCMRFVTVEHVVEAAWKLFDTRMG